MVRTNRGRIRRNISRPGRIRAREAGSGTSEAGNLASTYPGVTLLVVGTVSSLSNITENVAPISGVKHQTRAERASAVTVGTPVEPACEVSFIVAAKLKTSPTGI